MKTEATTDLHDGQPKERETRQWWALDSDSGMVKLVTGYTCAPQNPGYWWVPQLGSSMSEGHHLFATERDAIERMITTLRSIQTETEERIVALNLRLKRL